MKYSSYFYFAGLFLFFLLIFNYNFKLLNFPNEDIKLCSKLNYEDSLNLHPNNFGKTNLTLNIIDERKWRTIIFEDEIRRLKNKKGNSSFYTNRKRVDASIEVKVNANLKCILLAEIRPHGDMIDHRQGSGLPSLNVKLKNGHLFGIVHFILFRPQTRNFDNEIFATTFLRELNILAPRSSKIKVAYRNLESNFIFQEKIAKEFLENSSLRESAIFEGDQRFLWYDPYDTINLSRHRLINKNWAKKGNSSHFISETGLSILNEINQYYRGDVSPDETVDYYTTSKKLGMSNFFDKLPLFDSMLYALEASHNLSRDDRHFYYDPTIRKFFPIYYDGTPALLSKHNKILNYNMKDKKVTPSAVHGASEALERLQVLKINNLHNQLLKNGVKLKKDQVEKLIIIIKDKLNILKKYNENNIIKVSVDTKSKSYMEKDFVLNNKFKKRRFIYYDDKFHNYLDCSIYGDDCKKIILNLKNKIRALAQELKDENKNSMIFVGKKRKSPTNKGWFSHYAFEKKLPANKIQRKTISKNVNLILYGNADFKIDSSLKIIELKRNSPSDKFVFFGGTLDNWKIIFKDESEKFKKSTSRFDVNGYTGCVSFFDLKLINVSIESTNAQCEDAVNFVRTEGSIEQLIVKDSLHDSVDADFSLMEFNLVNIQNSNNDCIDLSYGDYSFKKVELKFCGDKAISVGETSKVKIEDLLVSNANIGLAAKDYGFVSINNGKISKTKSCVEAYNKKQEFSGGYVTSNKLKCIDSVRNSWTDKHSLLKVNFL